MRIGETDTRCHALKCDRQFQHNSLCQARFGSAIEEARSHDDIDVTDSKSLDERDRVFEPVLTIRIEHRGILGFRKLKSVVNSSLERGALAQIDRMLDDMSAGLSGLKRRSIGTAIIDANDVRELCAYALDDVTNDAGFIVKVG